MKWIWIGMGALTVLAAGVAMLGYTLPKGHVASRKAVFAAPPERIWELITGPPGWRPDVKKFEPLPATAGRRTWAETDSRGQRITFEEVEAVPPRRLVTRIADPKLPFGGTWTYEIAADGGRTEVRITEKGEIYNVIFRVAARYYFGYTATLEAYLKALAAKLGENVTISDGQAGGAGA
jgi:uncharacterized protein YndB with AHSA1/START domain